MLSRLIALSTTLLVLGCSDGGPTAARRNDETQAPPTLAAKSRPVADEILRIDDPQRHAGVAATSWDLDKPFLTASAGESIASVGNVQMWMHLAGPADGVPVTVTVAGKKLLTGTIVLSGRGWRRVLITSRTLTAAKPGTAPLPADSTVRLQLAGPAPTGLAISIADVRTVAVPNGPNLTDDDLLAQINWDIPGLSRARGLLAAGDRTGALRGLAAYVRNRPKHWLMPAIESRDTACADADRYLRGEVGHTGLLQAPTPDGAIDWLANPTMGKPNETFEWVFGLNRHMEWICVAQAWTISRKDTYAAGWARLLRSWVKQVPAPALDDEGPGSGWRDIEAGLRMSRPWFESFYAVADNPAVTDDDIILFLKSVWDHATYLSAARFNPSNHFIFANTGLYTAGAEFPEFTSATSWRTIAGRNLERSLTVSTLEEGGWYELAPGYGSWVCNKSLDMWDNAEASGQTAELTPMLRDKLRKMAEWGVRLVSPDGAVPMLNDGGPLTFKSMKLDRSSRRFPDSALLRWAYAASTGNTTVAEPPWTSEALPDSGYTVMRTGWSVKDSYLLLDGGPLGAWHGHQDALNLMANFHGRYFLFDNGGYKYDKSDWRKYGPSTAAHNTVLVDGLGQDRSWNGEIDPATGLSIDKIGKQPDDMPKPRFGTSAGCDYASAWYVSGYSKQISKRMKQSPLNNPNPASHHREVLFIKPSAGDAAGREPYAVVLDTLTPKDAAEHRYDLRWHLKTTAWQTSADKHVTWTTDSGQPNLAILSLHGADVFHADSGVKQPELLGWWYNSQNDEPAPALTLRHLRSGVGPVQMLTVLLPFQGDPTTCPVELVVPAGDNAWTVQMKGQPAFTVRLVRRADAPGAVVDGVNLPAIAP